MARSDKPGQVKPGEDGDVLARWSRRKLQARSGGVDLEQEPAAVSLPVEEADADAAGPAPQLTDADMPPLESLTEDSDYTPFLSPGVSDGLRRLALRKLFSQQTFNVTDGLNDYDGDYTQFTGLGKVVTREMRRVLQRELVERRPASEQPQPEDPTASQAGDSAAGAIAAGDAGGGNDTEEMAAASDTPESGDTGPGDKVT